MLPSLQRRLTAEWNLLQDLAAANPGRLTGLAADDLTFRLCLRETPALPLSPHDDAVQRTHSVRIDFPYHFPAAPLELYLTTPMQHPNIHPETGFVCIWDRHRVSHTSEHALHKLIAILGWRLYNKDAPHVMQQHALTRMHTSGPAVAASLSAPLLQGIRHHAPPHTEDSAEDLQPSRRLRLS